MRRILFTISRLRCLAIAPLLLMLAGCSAHYRQALEDYRRAEPIPFHLKTMEWAQSADTAAADLETSAGLTNMELRPTWADELTTSPQSVFLRFAADFFDMEPIQLAQQLEPLKHNDQLQLLLADQLQWEELSLAVAWHNPSIQAARDHWQATLNQYNQAIFLENLIAEFRAFTRYLKVDVGKRLNQKMIQQFFPYPSTISLKGELIGQQALVAELNWQLALRSSVVKAGESFFEYQQLHRAEKTTRENVKLVENFLRVIEERYQSGTATQANLLKVQTELQRQNKLLLDLQARIRVSRAQLNALLNRAPTEPLGPPTDEDLAHAPPAGVEQLLQAALTSRQEINRQRAKVARITFAIRLGEVMNRPLISQGYSNFERGMVQEASAGAARPSYGLKAKAADRPAFAQAEAYLTELRQRLSAEKKVLAQLVAETGGMAQAMIDRLDIARREVELLEEIVLPQNQSAYESAMSGYASGRATFLDLLDSERELIKARLALHQARRDLNLHLLRLVNVRGRF